MVSHVVKIDGMGYLVTMFLNFVSTIFLIIVGIITCSIIAALPSNQALSAMVLVKPSVLAILGCLLILLAIVPLLTGLIQANLLSEPAVLENLRDRALLEIEILTHDEWPQVTAVTSPLQTNLNQDQPGETIQVTRSETFLEIVDHPGTFEPNAENFVKMFNLNQKGSLRFPV